MSKWFKFIHLNGKVSCILHHRSNLWIGNWIFLFVCYFSASSDTLQILVNQSLMSENRPKIVLSLINILDTPTIYQAKIIVLKTNLCKKIWPKVFFSYFCVEILCQYAKESHDMHLRSNEHLPKIIQLKLTHTKTHRANPL